MAARVASVVGVALVVGLLPPQAHRLKASARASTSAARRWIRVCFIKILLGGSVERSGLFQCWRIGMFLFVAKKEPKKRRCSARAKKSSF